MRRSRIFAALALFALAACGGGSHQSSILPDTAQRAPNGADTSKGVLQTMTAGASGQVNISSSYNVYGIYTDGSSFSTGGFDSDGYAFSSTQLGTSTTYNGLDFTFGPANALDAVDNATISLPANQYTKLSVIGAAVNGAQTNQSFVVTYTNGTKSTFTQSMSDWASPQSYSGETTVSTMSYRDEYNGTESTGTFHVYGYTFTLNSAKTVKSIKLPANRDAVFLGVALIGTGTGTPTPPPTPTPSPTATPPPGGGTFPVLNDIPQFGIYTGGAMPSGYSPPAGITMLWDSNRGYWWSISKLTTAEQGEIGSNEAAQITYLANCDNYDRLAGVIMLQVPHGTTPTIATPITTMVQFITPFSDYTQGTLATHVYPNADISPYAYALADTSVDVWVGTIGGSNPYNGDPCNPSSNPSTLSQETGFSYSLSLTASQGLPASSYTLYSPVAFVGETTLPTNVTFSPSAAQSGRVTIISDSHGPDDEYEYTTDTETLNGSKIASFSTEANCATYQQYSPDGNPGIFENNTTSNPRNWCPGAVVPSHTYPASLIAGSNTFSLSPSPSTISSGDYFQTSINYTYP